MQHRHSTPLNGTTGPIQSHQVSSRAQKLIIIYRNFNQSGPFELLKPRCSFWSWQSIRKTMTPGKLMQPIKVWGAVRQLSYWISDRYLHQRLSMLLVIAAVQNPIWNYWFAAIKHTFLFKPKWFHAIKAVSLWIINLQILLSFLDSGRAMHSVC